MSIAAPKAPKSGGTVKMKASVVRKDPPLRKDGRCSVCKTQDVPPIAAIQGDPFCSTKCCRAWYALDESTATSS